MLITSSLPQDLPDSIQVGGRISPQTVWDYVEKIKASGTKVRYTSYSLHIAWENVQKNVTFSGEWSLHNI